MAILDFRRENVRLLFLVGLLIFVVVIGIGTAYLELRLREDEIEHQTELAATQVHAYEDYLTQSLNNAHLALRNSVDMDDLARGPARVGESFKAVLRHAPLLRSISLLDDDGVVVASSNPANIGLHPNLLGYLPYVANHAEIMRVGIPWRGRDFDAARPTAHADPAPPDALTFLPITCAIVLGDRHYTLLAATNTDYLLNYFNQQLQPGDAAIQVLRYDGTLILSTSDRDKPGALVDGFRLADEEFGSYPLIDANGRHILAAHRLSRHYPLAVAVLRDRDALLAAWRKETFFVAIVVTVSLLFVIGLATSFYRRLAQAARLQEQADQRLRLAAKVFEASPEGILVTDVDATIVSVNPAFIAITGFSAEDAIGRNPRILASGRHPPEFHAALWRELIAEGFWQGEIVNRRKSGDLFPEWLAISRVLDEQGAVSHYVGVFSEITDLKTDEARVSYLASHDFLTGLPNHAQFELALEQAIAHHRHGGAHLAVLFIGIESLHALNQQHGYAAGDALLLGIAERLRIGVRSSDTVCRSHGGKLLVLLEALESAEEAHLIAARLVAALEEPLQGAATAARIVVRIGLAVYPATGVDGSALIQDAKLAYLTARQCDVKLA